MKQKNLLIAILTGSFLIAGLLSGGVRTGEPAPDFTLTDTSGNAHSLSDFAGKYVVLEWLNHECPFVQKHYESGNMQALQRKWSEAGVVWLSINSTNPSHPNYKTTEEADALAESYNAAAAAILMDPTGKVGRLYGATATPHMYIINPDGELIYQGAIDSIPNARQASIPEATNYVEQTLQAAMDGTAIPDTDTKAYGCSIKYPN